MRKGKPLTLGNLCTVALGVVVRHDVHVSVLDVATSAMTGLSARTIANAMRAMQSRRWQPRKSQGGGGRATAQADTLAHSMPAGEQVVFSDMQERLIAELRD